MSSLVYVIIPISIIALNGPLVNSYIKSINRRKYCYKNIPLRKDTCLLQKKDECPMRSYKQCTNNRFPKKFCDCSRANYELCPHIKKDCRNKIAINSLPVNRLPKIRYPLDNPRVNIYNSSKSNFDILK